MEVSYVKYAVTIVNFALYILIILGIYRAIKGLKNFINRTKEMDKKLDIILNKLHDKGDEANKS
jgi:hypothetical protein